MKTKEINPTRPGSPTPCKHAGPKCGHSNESHLANKWLIYLASIKLTQCCFYHETEHLSESNKRLVFSANWRPETKVLVFQKRYFFGKSSNTSEVCILPEDGAKRLMQNYWLAMKSSVSTSIEIPLRGVLKKTGKPNFAPPNADDLTNTLYPGLHPWKTKNMATRQIRSWKTPLKWSLTRRSIPKKPNDLPKTFCVVTSRLEIRGGKMQRASVSGKSHGGVEKLRKGSGM